MANSVPETKPDSISRSRQTTPETPNALSLQRVPTKPVLTRVRISSRPLSALRMKRQLKKLNLTTAQHNHWCGFSLDEWLAANPS